MGAADYSVGNAPSGASYAAPLVGFQLGQQLARLPEDYFNATQRRLTLAKQNAFPNGMPTNPDGSPDVNAIINKGVKLGGLDYAAPLMQMLLGQQAGIRDAQSLLPPDGQGTQPASTIARPSVGAAGPGNLQPPSQPSAPRAPGNVMAAGSYAETGQDSVRSLATELFGGRDVSPLIPRFAAAIGVDPDAPLNPQQATQARTIMGRTAQGGAENAPTATAPASGTSGAPGAVPSTASETASPASGIVPNGPAATSVTGTLPSGYTMTAAENHERLGQTYLARGALAASRPQGAGSAAQFKAAAEAQFAIAKQIREALTKESESTPEQKNARASGGLSPLVFEGQKLQQKVATENTALTPEQKNALGSGGLDPLNFEKQKEVTKADVTAGEKKYEGIQHQADEAHGLVQTLRLNQSLMDDPNFYSGVGEEYNLLWKRIKASMGLDPNAAVPQEAFRKTVSTAILDQIRSLGGQGLGQVRVAEINVMKSAAQNQDNTPAANRLLSEIQMRLATRWTLPNAELAQAYKAGGQVTIGGKTITLQPHGYLDAGFDKLKTEYINATPLYSKEELADVRRIAPPLARTPADLKKIGWKDGDPFRTPDGRILTHLAPQGSQ